MGLASLNPSYVLRADRAKARDIIERSQEFLVQAIGPIGMTQPCPYEQIAPILREVFPTFL